MSISGNNLVLTLTSTSQAPYEAWSGGAAFDSDSNQDGTQNGMAWLLGAANLNTNATSRLPIASDDGSSLVLNFSCLNSASRGSAILYLNHIDSFRAGNPWVSVVVPESSATIGGIVFTVTANGNHNDVIARIPASGNSHFARLRATP